MALAVQISLPKMYCSVIGHQYYVEKHVTNYIKEYKCCRCGKEVTTDSKGNIVPLTEELRQIHESLQNLVARRQQNFALKRKTA